MEAPSKARRFLVGLLAIALLMLSGTMAWAVASDLDTAQTVPEGVRLTRPVGSPIDIGGMTREQLSACIETSVADWLQRPVYVRYKRTYFMDAGKFVTVNQSAMIEDAFRVREASTFASRVIESLAGTTQTVDIKPRYTVNTTAIQVWVNGLAKKIDKAPVNAVRKVSGNRVSIRASVKGEQLQRWKATTAIRTAIVSSKKLPKTVAVPVTIIKPKVTEASFGKTIVVDKSERRLYLYNGAKLVKSYRVAVGMPGYPTPLGQFKIVLKRYRPSWSNPGSAWAASMPAYIPPGPGNPLGTRALNLNASGIRIHGTNKVGSIGTAASHGCIRMLRANVEELYDIVNVGTAVYVVR